MKHFFRTLFSSAYLFLLPLTSFAQTSSGAPVSVSIVNPLGSTTTLCQLLKQILNLAITISVPVIIFFIVFAGFKFVIARGNPQKIDEARQNLMFTVIGIALFVGAWTLALVLANVINTFQPNTVNAC